MENLIKQALTASSSGQSADALLLLNTATEQFPDAFLPHYLIAAELASAKQYEQALIEFARALELEPTHQICRFQYALLLLTLNHTAESSSTISPLLELPETQYINRFALAIYLIANFRPNEAESPLRQGLAANNEIPDLNKDMALLLQRVLAYSSTSALNDEKNETLEKMTQLPAEVLIRSYTTKH